MISRTGKASAKEKKQDEKTSAREKIGDEKAGAREKIGDEKAGGKEKKGDEKAQKEIESRLELLARMYATNNAQKMGQEDEEAGEE
jgi:hypothetical protein